MRSITLSQGHSALIDDEDFEVVAGHSWHIRPVGKKLYAETKAKTPFTKCGTTTVLMHRLILEAKPGERVDHIDGDGLNNRRSNLRLVSASENAWNRQPQEGAASRFKGVCIRRRHGIAEKYEAWICKDGRRTYLGCFPLTQEGERQAALAYDIAAQRLFGEYAYLNFPHWSVRTA